MKDFQEFLTEKVSLFDFAETMHGMKINYNQYKAKDGSVVIAIEHTAPSADVVEALRSAGAKNVEVFSMSKGTGSKQDILKNVIFISAK